MCLCFVVFCVLCCEFVLCSEFVLCVCACVVL